MFKAMAAKFARAAEPSASGLQSAGAPGRRRERSKERSSSRIPERRKMRKPRRHHSGIFFVEAPLPPGQRAAADEPSRPSTPAPRKRRTASSDEEGGEAADRRETAKRRQTSRRLGGAGKVGDDQVVVDLLPPTFFHEDYLISPTVSRALKPAVKKAVAFAAQEGAPTPRTTEHGGDRWLRLLSLGFSLLVEGVGSKRRLLEAFADEALLPWGADLVSIDGFDTHFSLAQCLRDVLEQLHPDAAGPGAGQAAGEARRSLSSVEGLVAALCAARAAQASPRPLCLVVHNLDQIGSASWGTAQQAALASLAAAPGVHLVASVDHLMAPLAWHSRAERAFNWCREEVHTFEGSEVEASARYSDGPPIWCDPTAVRKTVTKASLGLVLRSLTGSHRELVEAIAKHQMDNGGKVGISAGKLLVITADLMIASSTTRLRSLLNELKDHEVVVQRVAADGETLFHLACSGKVLERLAEGLAPEESDADDSENDA